MMFGTFPKAFSQARTSQVYFPKWQLPKCSISQAATSQVCPRRSAQPKACSVLAAALGLNCSLRHLRGPNLTFGKLPFGKLYIWEVVFWEIVTWEKKFMKIIFLI